MNTLPIDYRRRSLVIPRLGLVLAGCLHLVQCSAVLAADPAPVFVLSTATGEKQTGPLEEIASGWAIRLGGDKATRTEGKDVVSLRRLGKPLPEFPEEEQVFLASGERIPAIVLSLTDESLRVQPVLGKHKQWDLPLSAVAAIWFAAPDRTHNPARLRRRLAREKRSRDVVTLRNGDVLEGIVTSFDRMKKKLEIEVDKKEISVDFGKLAVIALNTELVRRSAPKAPYARVVLANGCRLNLASARSDQHLLTGKTLVGMDVEIPLAKLAALDICGGRAIDLSDLKPSKFEQQPFLDARFPFVVDGCANGGDLRLAKGAYDKGLGIHAGSRLTYDLAGEYRRFEALVGIDNLAGRDGSARIRVLLDGKPSAKHDKELSQADDPHWIQIDTTGVRDLTLIVDFGRRGAVQAEVDWVDARLIK